MAEAFLPTELPDAKPDVETPVVCTNSDTACAPDAQAAAAPGARSAAPELDDDGGAPLFHDCGYGGA